MNRRIRVLYLLTALAGAALAADEVTLRARIDGVESDKPAAQEAAAAQARPERQQCLSRCADRDTRCSSEVRRARQQCSRNAATGGRDPFGGGRDPFTGLNRDFAYFCDYFADPPRACGSDVYSASCLMRFSQRHGVCVRVISDNVAAIRYDCFRNERDAQNQCREELR